MKKAIIFGIGAQYRYLKDKIGNDFVVVALSDNDKDKWGLIVDGVPVICPCSIMELDFDVVLVTPKGKALADIIEQLCAFGIPKTKIQAYDKGISPFVIDPNFFKGGLTREEKMKLFKDNVELLYIEFNSGCNRKCFMCPNSFLDRHSTNAKLDKTAIVKTLEELREIQYDSEISLSVYNEPMMDADLDDNVRLVKSYLPNAPLHFNTNGDYLTPARLADMETLNLDFLPVSLYIDTKEKPWNYQKSVEAIQMKAEKLGLSLGYLSDENNAVKNGYTTTAVAQYKSLAVVFRCADHRKASMDRGGSLPDDLPIKYSKRKPKVCSHVFHLTAINWNGDVTGCINFHPDYPAHKQYIMGNIQDQSIFDIWSNDKYTEFRKAHICDVSALACSTCGNNELEYSFAVIPGVLPFRDRPRNR